MGGFVTSRAGRWRLIDAGGQLHAGPLYDDQERSPREVQRLVDSWWRRQKTVDQTVD